ncbi:MAG: hypothetical protein GXX89_05125 [Clostridiales bacterium]|jgi:hypothetical protein|nr:hypothetical protein [Clostridiales bacterium]
MCFSNLFNGNSSFCWIILIILVLFLLWGNNGSCGCNTNDNCGNNPCC